jgi:hypothetical protein
MIIILLLFSCFGFSQNLPTVSNLPIDSTDNNITYKAVIKIPKATSEQIYSKIRAWMANIYNSANNVLQMDDKASGTLIAKGVFSYPNLHYPSFVKYILTVNIKPEKFRITITNYTLNIAGDDTVYPLENMYQGFKNDAHAKDEIDFNIKSQLIDMLNDVDNKSNGILKSLNNFMMDSKKDDF